MNRKQTIILLTSVFSLLLAFFVALNIFKYAQDSIRFANGTLKTTEYTLDEMLLIDFERTGNSTITTTSVDPQIIIENYNLYATRLDFSISFSKYPGEVNLYYTYADEEFTNSQKIWGTAKNDGSYEFILPRQKLSKIRIDPSNFTDVNLEIKSFILNPRRDFISYFICSGKDIFNYIILGMLICCLIACIFEGFGDKLNSFISKLTKSRYKNG